MPTLAEKNPGWDFPRLPTEKKNELVAHEFEKLLAMDASNMNPDHFEFARSDANKEKNRYANIFPFNWNVWPTPGSSPHYIGGSVIPRQLGGFDASVSVPHEFVASHAPLPNQLVDWYELMRGSGCKLVVMLTAEVEGGMTKADAYWPKDNTPLKVGDGTVVVEHLEHLGQQQGVVLRHLRYERPGYEAHRMQQVHYMQWPDFGVPTNIDGFLEVLKVVQQTPGDYPIFTHCSAGVGRTGTLITAYHAMELAKKGMLQTSSNFNIVSELKRLRWGMVQRREQYGFIFTCVSALLAKTEA